MYSAILYPEESVIFLNAINTDPDVRNILNYGINGIHYVVNESKQVEIITNTYRGIPYTQGNWFILKTSVDENPNKWELYKEFNNNAIESPILGFYPDFSECTGEYNAVSQVCTKYERALLTGTVNPDEFLPRLLKELKEAGIERLREAAQQQINLFLSELDRS